jgi:hypothetical protein
MALNRNDLAAGRRAWGGGTSSRRPNIDMPVRPPADTSDLSDKELDGVLMLAMDAPSVDLPGLDDCLARTESLLASPTKPSSEQLDGFMNVVAERGLIKRGRPLSWREYLGALLPS